MLWLLTLYFCKGLCVSLHLCFPLELCFSVHLLHTIWFCLFLSYFITTVFRCPFVSYERNQERMWTWVGEEVGMIWEELGEGEP